MAEPGGVSTVPAAGPAIRIEGLTKDYGSLRALDGLDLEIAAGEVVGFLGPNGAGKSTAIRILLDLIRPTAGRALILGRDCQSDGVAARALTGYLAGDVRLAERWTGAELVAYVAALRRTRLRSSELAALAERLDLDLSRRVGAYSRGNRRKLGLVLALAPRPPVLILDEPTSGLDPMRQRELWALLRERAADGTAVLLSSHVMSEVEAVCDRAAVLRHGRLLAAGTVADLLGRAPARLEVAFAGIAPRLDDVPGVRDVRPDGDGVSLDFDGDPNDLVRRLAGARIARLAVHPPRLEDVVLDLYRRAEEGR